MTSTQFPQFRILLDEYLKRHVGKGVLFSPAISRGCPAPAPAHVCSLLVDPFIPAGENKLATPLPLTISSDAAILAVCPKILNMPEDTEHA